MPKITALERRILGLFFKTVGTELGYWDFARKAFQPGVESLGPYQAALTCIRAQLASGIPAADLEELIRERYRAGERTALLSLLLKAEHRPGRLAWTTDLLGTHEPGHPELFVYRMPVLALTETGLRQVTPGSLTVKTEYTLRELADYYASQLPLNARHADQLGAWNWLLSQGTLTECLWAIDIARDGGRGASVLELSPHLALARDLVEARRARSKEENPT